MIEENNKKRIETTIVILISIFMVVNFIYFFEGINIYLKVAVITVFLGQVIMYIISYFKNNYKLRRRLYYCIIGLLIINLIILGVYHINQIMGILEYYGVKGFLLAYENKAKYIYFIICFLQPIILSIPEAVTIMAGSSIFGPLEGAIIGFSGTIIGIIIMFFMSRFASKNIINKIINTSKLEKFNKYIEKNEMLVVSALFIFPILPDEVICVGSGLTTINAYKFILIAIITKLITSFSFSYSLEVISLDFNSIIILSAIIMFIIFIKFIKSKK